MNAPDKSGTTPLSGGAGGGHVKIVTLLLTAGANPNAEDSRGLTPLASAAGNGWPEVVKLLLDAKADPNGGKLDAPLFCAIYKQDVTSAELLLQAGANPNAVGKIDFQRQPVFPVGSGRSVSPVGGFGNSPRSVTPLWFAISEGQLPMVQLLLKFKADPDGSQPDGKPLLFSALADTNILETLLAAGAKVDGRDTVSTAGDNRRMNRTPLIETVAFTAYFPAVEILLQHGADPNARDGFGQTPLHYATGIYENSQNSKIIELLLAHKADPNVRNEGGQTPLDLLKQTVAANTSENSMLSPGQRLSPEQLKLAGELCDLLRQHGALDKLPDWDRITLSRPSANFSQMIFETSTNDGNQFTLLEAILNFYLPQMQWPPPRMISFDDPPKPIPPTQGYSGNLAFPDLAQVTIVRHHPGTTNETRIKINLLNSTNGIGAKDVPLEFGDVVEIPERNHALGDRPVGLNGSEARSITDYLKGSVQLVTHEQKVELPIYISENSILGSVLKRPEAQKILLSSSDLSRVKVIRRDAKTGKTHEWIVDCSDHQSPSSPMARLLQARASEMNGSQPNNSQPSPDLWLRDGDVIEVPEKP